MIRLSIAPRMGDFQPIIRIGGKEKDVIGFKSGNDPHIKEFKLPTKRTLQKTSLALGKLAIFALV